MMLSSSRLARSRNSRGRLFVPLSLLRSPLSLLRSPLSLLPSPLSRFSSSLSLIRQPHAADEIVGAGVDVESAAPAEMVLDPRARVGECDTVSARTALALARTRIADLDADLAAGTHAADRDRAAGHLLDAVVDRVLDQRLQHQPGHRQLPGQRGDIELDVQPLAEAQLLDVEVITHEFEL